MDDNGYELRQSWGKCPGATGGISSVSISDKTFRQFTYEIPEEERVTHTMAIPVNMTISRPTKPYYEMFGYKSEVDMMRAAHIQVKTKDGDFCMTCNSELKECSLVIKTQDNGKTN